MTTARANGFFEAFVNERAYRPTAEDRALVASVTACARAVVPGSQVHWAGSQRKGTAVIGSDLDLALETREPVTVAQRRSLREALERDLGRPVTVLGHVLRLPAHGGAPKVDVAFTRAAFGDRELPDAAEFHDRRARQMTARALKLWTRAGNLPRLPGWVIEGLVVHLDAAREPVPLALFQRVLGWLEERATPAAIEAALRPRARPRWNEAWSSSVSGRLEALRNHARAIRRRSPGPEGWRSAEDVGRWLGQ